MSDSKNHGGEERDFTDKDIPLKPLLIFIVLTAAFTASVFLSIRHMMNSFERETAAQEKAVTEFAKERILPPQPLLQVDEKQTLVERRAEEQKQLHEYVWVDKSAGVVRIPIERAMELTLAKGLPARSVDGKSSK